MCLAVIALDSHPRYRIVVAANRDEFHARPTQAAHWWPNSTPPLLAGRDLQQGGTWLGVTPSGRFAFVTNVREPARHDPNAPTRGTLVPALLRDARAVTTAMASVVANAQHMNGFNLVAVDESGGAFASNRVHGVRALGPGLYGVSNAGLDTPWPKLVSAKAGVAAWLAAGHEAIDGLWPVLADTTQASDDALPHTGVTRERERLLSAPFIVSDAYGTRSSTIVTLDRDGHARFVERSYDAAGAPVGEAAFGFRVDQSERSIA
jgi:uncharacterized protein with NRDE domain